MESKREFENMFIMKEQCNMLEVENIFDPDAFSNLAAMA